jgi:pyridoxal phosphate enzyme (YggS family)
MVARQLEEVRGAMASAAARSGRAVEEVTLVAVSKGRSAEAILEAYEHGQRDFGENRAQELAGKVGVLPDDIRWHFIGSLQTRQAKLAAPHTHLLHSLDRARLINTWARLPEAAPALLQVNIAAETQKHGAAPEETRALLDLARSSGVRCLGLMTMPPQVEDAEDNRKWFRALAALGAELRRDFPELTHLSMGMTDDYEVAIEEGATLIRVGRAIFDEPGNTGKD